ncbi:MAG: CoA transferase [Deltaproteobacteria bacterium]|nr:CoA transferase [Deltaproteobacteria bacterium]
MFGAYSKSEGTGKRGGSSGAPAAASSVAADYARLLLESVGQPVADDLAVPSDPHPALTAAATGLLALTGYADGPPVPPPGHLAACARGALAALRALAPRHGDAALATLDGAALLGERAAVLRLARRGTTSAGGHCRLVRARDGWLAINLPRPDDRATVPAWLGTSVGADPWPTIDHVAGRRRAGSLVARARLLGLAAAEASPPISTAPPWHRVGARGRRAVPPRERAPLVLDLSSLWAGPLAAALLARAGARVVKIESTRRPDGVRGGPAAFFDLLHADKESVALDFATATGRRALVALVARADVVIESARPRAMHQLGIDPAALVRARPGLTWISITGYGRGGAAARWIGFGDDAGTAAGLAHATGRLAGGDTPLFCGDAIADPLTGMHAAVAALAGYRRGGGLLAALALRDVAAHALAFGPAASAAVIRSLGEPAGAPAWEVVAGGIRAPVRAPRARAPHVRARAFGADTDPILREFHVA